MAAGVRIAFLLFYYLLNCLAAKDQFAILLTMPVFLLCIAASLRSNLKWFTIDDMIVLVIYIFFAIGPLQALEDGYMPDGPVSLISFTHDELWAAMLNIVLFFSVFIACRYLWSKKAETLKRYTIDSRFLGPLFIINVLSFSAFVVTSGGFSILLTPRQDRDFLGVGGETSTFLPDTALGIQLVSYFLIACMAFNAKSKDKYIYLAATVALTIPMYLSQNPYNTARFVLIAAWFPLFYIVLRGRIHITYMYSCAFIFVIIVMPILNFTTRTSEIGSLSNAIDVAFSNSSIFQNIFHIPFIDVFDMSAFQIAFQDSRHFYWGQKTLGLIFFFIPRSIWPDKATLMALDLGQLLTNSHSAGTPNLSFFVAGDFFADGGIIGVALGAFAVSLLLIKGIFSRRILVFGVDITSAIFIAAMPILIRGPLGAVIGLTAVEMLALVILVRMFGRSEEEPQSFSQSLERQQQRMAAIR